MVSLQQVILYDLLIDMTIICGEVSRQILPKYAEDKTEHQNHTNVNFQDRNFRKV